MSCQRTRARRWSSSSPTSSRRSSPRRWTGRLPLACAGRKGPSAALRSAFRAWVVETTTSASPFRFGQFTVEADNKGINLTRWDAGEVTREDLLLPAHVWDTVDKHVHARP